MKIVEEKLTLKEKIKAHFSQKNKLNRQQGQGASAVAVACETVYLSGAVDNFPKIQMACHVGAIIFGLIAGKKVKQTLN